MLARHAKSAADVWSACRIRGRTTRGASTRRRGPPIPQSSRSCSRAPTRPAAATCGSRPGSLPCWTTRTPSSFSSAAAPTWVCLCAPVIPLSMSLEELLSAVSEVWHMWSRPSPTTRMGDLVKEGCLSWGVPDLRLTLSLLRRAPAQAPAQEPGRAPGRGREERCGQGRLR